MSCARRRGTQRTTALSLDKSAAHSTTLQPLRSAMGLPRGARTPSTHVPLVESSVSKYVPGPALTIDKWLHETAGAAAGNV